MREPGIDTDRAQVVMQAPAVRRPRSGPSIVEYDIHGLIGIRLVDPSSRDIAAVNRQVGDARASLAREPDITIRFVGEVPTRGVLRYVEPTECGYSDEEFLVLAPGSGGPAAQIPLDTVGGRCEILCRSGLDAVPLLRPIVSLNMLAKGVAALHASAFTYKGQGAIVAGWANGAKTTSLLAFMANGAEFIADDCVYVSPDGNRLYGLAEPLALRKRHLDELPGYRELVDRRDRARLRTLSALGGFATSVGGRGRHTGVRKLADRTARVAADAHTTVLPDRLFGRSELSGNLAKAFLSIPHASGDVFVERVDPDWLANRLVFALLADRQRILARYVAFRFAFPDRTSELIEQASAIEHDILSRVLRNTETYVLYHPFPTPAQTLFEALAANFD